MTFNKRVEHESLLADALAKRRITVKSLSVACAVSVEKIYGLFSGRFAPVKFNQAGTSTGLRESVKRICSYLQVEPERMFPRYFCHLEPRQEELTLTDSQILSHSTSEHTLDKALTSAEDRLAWREEHKRLWEHVRTIRPRRYRAAFVLHWFRGYPSGRIGDMLKVSKQTIFAWEQKCIMRLLLSYHSASVTDRTNYSYLCDHEGFVLYYKGVKIYGNEEVKPLAKQSRRVRGLTQWQGRLAEEEIDLFVNLAHPRRAYVPILGSHAPDLPLNLL